MSNLKGNVIFDDKNKFLNYIICNIAEQEDVDLMLPYNNEEMVDYKNAFDKSIKSINHKLDTYRAFVECRMMELSGGAITRDEYLKKIEKENESLKKSLEEEDMCLQQLYYKGCVNGFKKGFESAMSFTRTLGSI